MIEEKKLYPVTILSALRKSFVEILFRHGIILAQDIAHIDEHSLIKKSGMSPHTVRLLKRQAIELCPLL